ncbi:MAG: hypothetical protein IKB85_02735 [Bacteroidales bacterium]|nr:hypothetical protein [Bacteroidales bacterium]
MMNTFVRTGTLVLLLAAAICSCEIIDNDMDKHVDGSADSTYVSLEDVAAILSGIPLQLTHMDEVHSAVVSSSENGYDEEYTMKSLFESPGAGVGDKATKSNPIENPLRDLIETHVRSGAFTKASSSDMDPDAFLEALTSSDIQIYWPLSEGWNGEVLPVITFDPENGAETNIGYKIVLNDDGTRQVEEVIVTEEMAESRPVWVVNRNSDAEFTSLEMLRREDPAWGGGGGNIIIEPRNSMKVKGDRSMKTLILKDFVMKRNYDSWFAGASEFHVRVGAVEDFTASTEAELKLYNPAVTDFMIVVRRGQVGKPQPFNAVLVSDWTDQLTSCAFMITEDDGGTRTEWNCTALVRIASKSYGVEMKLPFNSRDDIVWRGQLSSKWLEATSNMVGHFGDVDLTFEVLEY